MSFRRAFLSSLLSALGIFLFTASAGWGFYTSDNKFVAKTIDNTISFSDKSDPLYRDIMAKYQVSEEEQKNIDKVLKALADDLQKNGLDKAKISFFPGNRTKDAPHIGADLTYDQIKASSIVKDEVKCSVRLPAFARKEGGEIKADVMISINTDVFYGEDWELTLGGSGKTWTIKSGKVIKTYTYRYKNGALVFHRYVANDAFTLDENDSPSLDSVEYSFAKGSEFFVGYVLDKVPVLVYHANPGSSGAAKDVEPIKAKKEQVNQVIVSKNLPPETVYFEPPTAVEKQQLRKYAKQGDIFQSNFNAIIMDGSSRVLENLFTKLTSDKILTLKRDSSKEQKALGAYLDIVNPRQLHRDEFVKRPNSFETDLNAIEIRMETSDHGTIFYDFDDNAEDHAEDVTFAGRTNQELSDMTEDTVWCQFFKKSKRDYFSWKEKELTKKGKLDFTDKPTLAAANECIDTWNQLTQAKLSHTPPKLTDHQKALVVGLTGVAPENPEVLAAINREKLTDLELDTAKYFKTRNKRISEQHLADRLNPNRIQLNHIKGLGVVQDNWTDMDCDLRVELYALKENLQFISVYFDRHMLIDNVVDENGRAVHFIYTNPLTAAEGTLTIFFPKPLTATKAGDDPKESSQFTFFVKSHGMDILKEFDGKLYMVRGANSGVSWLPGYAQGYLADQTIDMLVGVPKPAKVAGTVLLYGKYESNGKNFFHWASEIPVFLAGVMIGPYAEEDYVDNNVILESGKKGLRLEGYVTTAPIRQIFDNPLHDISVEDTGDYGSGDTIDFVRQLEGSIVEVDFAKSLKYNLFLAENALDTFSRMFGPFPYDKMAMAAMPYGAGFGQGWPSLIVLDGYAFVSQKDYHYRLSIPEFFSHELSHQWWGHAVPWFSPHDQWLSESFAQISSFMYTQSRSGNRTYQQTIKYHNELALKVANEGSVWLGAERLGDAYISLTYDKGAIVMHMLRYLLTTNGDPSLFLNCLRNMVKEAYSRPTATKGFTTLEFEEICERTVGTKNLLEMFGEPSLDFFFDEWLYGWGYPDYLINWSTKNKKQVTCTVIQQQKDIVFKMPVIFTFTMKNGKTEDRRVINDKKEQTFTFDLDNEVADVQFDRSQFIMGLKRVQRVSS